MDNEQKKFLRERLSTIKSNHRNAVWSRKVAVSPEVRRARKVIAAHERTEEKIREKARARMEREAAKAMQSILFGDEKKAIAQVDAFEARRFV